MGSDYGSNISGAEHIMLLVKIFPYWHMKGAHHTPRYIGFFSCQKVYMILRFESWSAILLK
jgi:hypothetical protein